MTRGALAAILVIGVVRVCTAAEGKTLRLVTMTDSGERSSRLVDRLVDESDVAVAGTRVLVASGFLSDDARELPSAMRLAYERMRREEGDAPSPLGATYLGLERPSMADVLVVEPPSSTNAGVIFLHGYAGSFTLPCLQVARAVRSLGVVTACPSTGWQGLWDSRDGEATLRRTVELLRARGVERIVLVGLSNGGIGASALAPRMRGAFVGVVLVSGAEAGAASAGVPTLVIHGKHDTMADVAEGRAYAARHGSRYVEVDAGHFAMLVRGSEVDRALRSFVEDRL